MVSFVFGIFVSVIGLLLEELALWRDHEPRQLITLMACAIVENFGYRQFILWCRIQGVLEYLFNKGSGWGEKRRKVFLKSETTSPS